MHGEGKWEDPRIQAAQCHFCANYIGIVRLVCYFLALKLRLTTNKTTLATMHSMKVSIIQIAHLDNSSLDCLATARKLILLPVAPCSVLFNQVILQGFTCSG